MTLSQKKNSLFDLFLKYWDTCRKRDREHSMLQVEFVCAEIYQVLSNYWKRKNWPVEKIDVICNALSVWCYCMNPNNFLHEKIAYICHIKNLYLLAVI